MKHHRNRILGRIVMYSGVIIILTIVLPSTAWWIVFGIFLVISGLWLLKCGI